MRHIRQTIILIRDTLGRFLTIRHPKPTTTRTHRTRRTRTALQLALF